MTPWDRAYCPDCQREVERAISDPRVGSITIDDAGRAFVEAQLVDRCDKCGRELMAVTLELQEDLEGHLKDHLKSPGHGVHAETAARRRLDSVTRAGDVRRGASVAFRVSCSCGQLVPFLGLVRGSVLERCAVPAPSEEPASAPAPELPPNVISIAEHLAAERRYGEQVAEAAGELERMAEELFGQAVGIAMAGPWRAWSEAQPLGAVMTMSEERLAGANDAAVNALLKAWTALNVALEALREEQS